MMGAALVSAVVWLSAGTSRKAYATYLAYMRESVSGLSPKASVKYRGVEVGKVVEISLDRDDPQRVQLLLDIEEGTPIKQDTVAILATQGITGLAYVELTGGSRSSPLLQVPEDGRYPEIRTGPSLFVRIDSAVTSALTELGKVAVSLNGVAERIAVLLGPSNQEVVSKTLGHIEQLTGSLSAQGDNLAALVQSTARAAESLPSLIHTAQGTVGSVQDMTKSIEQVAASADRLLTAGQRDWSRFSADALGRMGPLLAELQQLVVMLRRLSQELERNPNALLFGRPATRPGPGE
jgi:phospholipid/cholesterol/gamma-HCH transport system substrate-binding protein